MAFTSNFLPFAVIVTPDFERNTWLNIARLHQLLRSVGFKLAEFGSIRYKSFKSMRVSTLNSLLCKDFEEYDANEDSLGYSGVSHTQNGSLNGLPRSEGLIKIDLNSAN